MFDRLEFIVQRVLDRKPDPTEEINFLKEHGMKMQQEQAPLKQTPDIDVETIGFDESEF